jgi:hypothetical protein
MGEGGSDAERPPPVLRVRRQRLGERPGARSIVCVPCFPIPYANPLYGANSPPSNYIRRSPTSWSSAAVAASQVKPMTSAKETVDVVGAQPQRVLLF